MYDIKINRFIGIISLLQNNRKVMTSCLVDMFLVSRRMINCDIEWKCTDADEALYQILAYGEHAMIVDPPEMKTKIKEIIQEMLNKYD